MGLPLLSEEYGHLGAGGSELQAALLAKALARRGFRVSLVVNDYGQADGARWHGVTTLKAYRPDAGIPIVRFAHPRWTSTWAAMRRADADIYYVNCQGMQVAQAVLFAQAHRRKTVYWVASDSDCSPETLVIEYWRDRKLYEYGLRRVNLVLAQTAEQQHALRRNFGVDSRLMESLVDFPSAVRTRDARDFDVLWVGNFRALKRPELLFELAKRLPGLSFHMVGGPAHGSLEVYAAALRAAEALPNVRFHGPVPYQRVGELYERARVFVSTSSVEGLPNAYLQSWARGTPVVAFLDPERMIETQGLGRAVSSLDEMHTAVAALSAPDSLEWAASSARCIEYMSGRYGESNVVSRYVETLYA
ncbi:MAG: glycosyltransferase family 4 protein, partial [Steroidobacteraceae bacterium]